MNVCFRQGQGIWYEPASPSSLCLWAEQNSCGFPTCIPNVQGKLSITEFSTKAAFVGFSTIIRLCFFPVNWRIFPITDTAWRICTLVLCVSSCIVRADDVNTVHSKDAWHSFALKWIAKEYHRPVSLVVLFHHNCSGASKKVFLPALSICLLWVWVCKHRTSSKFAGLLLF